MIRNQLLAWNWVEEPDRLKNKFKYVLYRYESKLKRSVLATLLENPFPKNSWRIDTSNHCCKQEKEQIVKVVQLFSNPHKTRLDIAFDFINCPHAGMLHKFYGTSTTESSFYSETDKKLHVETLNYGKRTSKVMYRYYDKKLEQLKHNIDFPYQSWERLEIQLRGNKTNELEKECLKMLDRFKLCDASRVKYTDPDLYIFLLAYEVDPDVINLKSKGTKAKRRKQIKNNEGFDTCYADSAREVLDKELSNLYQEIQEFFDIPNQAKIAG